MKRRVALQGAVLGAFGLLWPKGSPSRAPRPSAPRGASTALVAPTPDHRALAHYLARTRPQAPTLVPGEDYTLAFTLATTDGSTPTGPDDILGPAVWKRVVAFSPELLAAADPALIERVGDHVTLHVRDQSAVYRLWPPDPSGDVHPATLVGYFAARRDA